MLIEYLFEINPVTLLLIMATLIFFISKSTKKSGRKQTTTYEEIAIEFQNKEKSENSNTILVQSYNIMSYNFTRFEWFSYCDPQYLAVSYRAPRILNEIEKLNADVICLQECDHDLFIDYFKPNLEDLGYESVYKINASNKIVTNITVFKTNVFKLEDKNLIDLNEGLEELDESFVKYKECLITILKHYQSGKSLVVANTQLFWNPELEYIKYGEATKILGYLQKNFDAKTPIILCGDMNSNPDSNVIRYFYKDPPSLRDIKNEKNKYYIEKFFKENLHTLKLRSAYDNYFSNGNYALDHPKLTTATQEFNGNQDYIFYTNGNLSVTQILQIPNDEIIEKRKLPNYKFPSDHLKIAARFKFI